MMCGLACASNHRHPCEVYTLGPVRFLTPASLLCVVYRYGALRNLCYITGPDTADDDKEARHRALIQEHEIVAVLLRPLNCEGNLDLGDETLESLHATIRALIPPLSSDETPPPELDPVNDLRRDVLESLLLLTRSEIGEQEMTSTRNILPLMEVRACLTLGRLSVRAR